MEVEQDGYSTCLTLKRPREGISYPIRDSELTAGAGVSGTISITLRDSKHSDAETTEAIEPIKSRVPNGQTIKDLSGGGWRGVLVYWPKVYGYDVVGNRPRTEPDYAWKPEGTEMQGWMDQATMRSFGRADLFSPELTMSITFEAAASGSVYRDADTTKEPMPIIWDSRAQVQAWHAQVRDEILKKLETFLMPEKGSGTVSVPPENPTTENAERLWTEGKTAYEAGDLVGAEEKALASVKLLPKPERVDFANKLQKANQLWKEGQELYKRKDYDGTLAVCTESIALAGSPARVKFVESLRNLASPQKTPARRMVRIEGGVYTRGNVLGDKEAGSTPGEFSEPVEEPAHKIEVGAFEIENLEVTKALWDEVATWSRAHGYELGAGAAGKADSHPVQSVTWYDCVKWCNARSEKESRRPCYYTDAAYTKVLRTGTPDLAAQQVDWTATGYRLPTEAEWEKASRGGVVGQRYPWGNTISHDNAVYMATNRAPSFALSTYIGRHPRFNTPPDPPTAPAGSFQANGIGLYDTGGNVYEWCWDWFDRDFYKTPQSRAKDCRGPDTAAKQRVIRGGGWLSSWWSPRCSARKAIAPLGAHMNIGFRCARSVPASDGGLVLDPAPKGEPADVTQMTLQAGVRKVAAGQSVTVPVWLSRAAAANMNFNVGYDAAVVAPAGAVAKGNLLDKSLFEANTAEKGLVRIGFAQGKDLSGVGTVAQIQFKAVGQPGDRSALRLEVVKAATATAADTTVAVIHGEVLIVGEDGEVPWDADGDGVVTAGDSLSALKMSVKLIPSQANMDADKDGQVTSHDAMLILQKVVEK